MEPAAQSLPTPSNKKRFLKPVLITAIAVGIGLFFYYDAGRFFTLEALKANREALAAATERHYALSVILFILLYCLQTTLSLPGATIMTLAGGFLFGVLLGTVYVNVGATTGAAFAFLAARYLFRDLFERKFGGRLEAIERGVARNGFHYLLTLRLIPLFPFFLVNIAAGLTHLPLGTYVLATAVGIVPASFVYANAGRQIGSIESVGDIASPRVVGAFILLGLLALLPVIYRRRSGKSLGGSGRATR